MFRRRVPWFWLLSAIACFCPESSGRCDDSDEQNMARGKPYILAPPPNYEHCTDANDHIQLTDGELTKDYFWTNPATVGWVNSGYGSITIDLGQIEPISGVSFRTAAGVAGVQWPRAIRVLVSDDGATYRDTADLLVMDQDENGPLPDEGYAVRRLVTHRLQTRGRYVRLLMVISGSYGFADEVEVFRGPNAWRETDPGGRVVPGDAEGYDEQSQIDIGIQGRLSADQRQIGQAIERAALADQTLGDQTLAEQLQAELQAAGTTLDPQQIHLESFTARIPLNDSHARLFAVQGKLWRAMGNDRLTIRIANPWDPLDLHAPPAPADPSTIDVHVMRGEFRSAAINVWNCGERPAQLSCRVEGLPDGTAPACLSLYSVPWTDTREGRPVAAALEKLTPEDGSWQMTVLPGLPSQTWLSFHVAELPPGDYAATLLVEPPDADTVRVPLNLHVYPFDFPQQTTLLLGGWSYTNGRGSYGITAHNKTALRRHLQEHFVNAPWAGGSVLSAYEFRDDGSINFDPTELDQWLDEWPAAKRYHVFVHVPTSCGGADMGTPQFAECVGKWIGACVQHLRQRGIAASQLALLLRDEPSEAKDTEPIVAWSRAIHAAEPNVIVWEDPTFQDPQKAPTEFWGACDVVCPNRVMWLAGPETLGEFYRDQQRQGRTLQFYSCSGPARLLDPYSYYRLQAWHCWQVGATGSFFWAFGDDGGASSWNEYAAKRPAFTPVYLDEQSVTPAKQMEAIRESVEDFEYLVMLRDAIARAKDRQIASERVAAAQTLLDEGVREVLATAGTDKIFWHDSKDRSRADRVRVAVLKMLAQLR